MRKHNLKITSLLLIAVIMAMSIAPMQISAAGCTHPHTTTQYHTYYSSVTGYYHSVTLYEETICTDCYQSLGSVIVSGYPQLEVHPKVITGSPGVHTGIYSRHYFIYYEDCYTCGYHFQEHRSTHCTPNACNEPSF